VSTQFGTSVLDAASRLIAPFMLMFGAYVVTHGHYSPGGGFQGGVIFAVAVILARLVHGRDARWGIRPRLALGLACAGAGLYMAIGLLGLLFRGNFLDYGMLPLPLKLAEVRAVGTLGIEIGVALTVTGVLTLIFDALAGMPDEEI
jgi:multicomponent Na+:H+ antiporter subunit B